MLETVTEIKIYVENMWKHFNNYTEQDKYAWIIRLEEFYRWQSVLYLQMGNMRTDINFNYQVITEKLLPDFTEII